jgi:hypothetical protein
VVGLLTTNFCRSHEDARFDVRLHKIEKNSRWKRREHNRFLGALELEARMPKFNINIRTQSHIAKTLTVERGGHTAIRIELARFVGELLKNHAALIWVDEDWQIDVSDDAGLILYVMHIAAMKTAATTTDTA